MNRFDLQRILRNFKLNKYIILLIIIILFHIINNLYIINVDTTPVFMDHGEYLATSIDVHHDLKNGRIIKAITEHYTRYPNLFFWLTSISYTLFGISKQSAQITSVIPLVILVFSIYGIGAKLHSRKTGVLAAFIVITFPHVFSMVRYYTLDFNSMAFLALSIFTLLTTNKFTSRWKSIFFGVCLGLTTLTRPSFMIFFIGPFLFYIYKSFFPKKEKLKRKGNNKMKLTNLTLALLITSSIALTWWNIPYFINRFQDASLYLPGSDLSKTQDLSFYLPGSGKINPFNPIEFRFSRIIFYITTLAVFQIFYYYFIIFFFAIIYFILFKKKDRFFLLSGFLIPYLFFTFYVYHNPNIRFIFPYLLFIALIISIFIFNIQNRKFRLTLIFLTIIFSVMQFIFLSYVPQTHSFFDRISKELFIDDQLSPDLFDNNWYIGILSPYNYDWNYDKILDIINNSISNNKETNVEILVDQEYTPLIYVNKMGRWEKSKIILKNSNEKSLSDRLMQADFLIVQKFTDNLSEVSPLEMEQDIFSQFSLIGAVPWPFNATIEIYKKES